MKTQSGSRGRALLFLWPQRWMGIGWLTPRPGRFTPGRRPGTHCTGGWVGPRAGLDGCGKCSCPPGFDPRIFQPVESSCTDWDIAAHNRLVLVAFVVNKVAMGQAFFIRVLLFTPVSAIPSKVHICLLSRRPNERSLGNWKNESSFECWGACGRKALHFFIKSKFVTV